MQDRNQPLGNHHPHDFPKQVRRLGPNDLETLGDLSGERAFSGSRRAAYEQHQRPLAPKEFDQDEVAPSELGAMRMAEIAIGEEPEPVAMDLCNAVLDQMPEDGRRDRAGIFNGQAA